MRIEYRAEYAIGKKEKADAIKQEWKNFVERLAIDVRYLTTMKVWNVFIPNGNHEIPSILQDLEKQCYRFGSKNA